jgi:hypothetical protein
VNFYLFVSVKTEITVNYQKGRKTMTALSYFITVLTLSLVSSGVFICWQQAAIGRLLDESCPGSGAHYWRHTLAALQLLIPMLLVLVFASRFDGNLVDSLRTAMIWLLLGHLLAVMSIAKIVWKRLVPPPEIAAETAQPHNAIA